MPAHFLAALLLAFRGRDRLNRLWLEERGHFQAVLQFHSIPVGLEHQSPAVTVALPCRHGGNVDAEAKGGGDKEPAQRTRRKMGIPEPSARCFKAFLAVVLWKQPRRRITEALDRTQRVGNLPCRKSAIKCPEYRLNGYRDHTGSNIARVSKPLR